MKRSFTVLAVVAILCLDWQLAFSQSLQNPSQEQTKDETTEPNKKETEKEDKKDEKTSAFTILRVEVTDANTSTPITGASVYVRSDQGRKTFEKEPRTDTSGVVRISGVPRGKVLVQVTADGWFNGGDNYNLNQSEQTIKIKLKKEN